MSLLRSLGLMMLLLGLWARPALAQTGIQAVGNSASVHFPVNISFHLQAHSTWHITHVTLEYGLLGHACDDSQAQQVISFTASTSIDVSWKLAFSSLGGLPPGAQVWWQWDILDDSGDHLLTPRQTRVIADDGYDWHSLTRQSVTVTWSQGSQAFGAQLLNLALTSLDRLNRQMGVRPAGPVQLIIYPTAEAVRGALVYVPEWTGGVAYPEYDLTVIGIAPGENGWAATVVPHELTHLVVGTLVFNCRGISLPTWLNEGLAVVAQGPATSQDLASLSAALQGGALPTLRSLGNGFQADAAQASLSYTRSGQVVRYLITTYGADHLSSLLTTMQSGSPIDAALGQVYGLDTDRLDSAWRVSQGAAPLPTQAPAATTGPNTPVPTLALWTAVPAVTAPAAAVTATLAPTASPTPRAIAAVPTGSPAPAATSTLVPTATPAPGRGLAAFAPWLLGCAGVLLCGLMLGLGAIGFWRLRGKA